MLRIDDNRVQIAPEIELFANQYVFVDRRSVDEIMAFATVRQTIDQLRQVGFLPDDSMIERIVLTPDFHRGAGIPIGTVFRSWGFVMPRAVGSDIGCGMRFIMTDVTREEFDRLGRRLDQRLRHMFFEGGRDIPMSAEQRSRLFRHGLAGLVETPHSSEGLWRYWDDRQQTQDLDRLHCHGSFETDSLFGVDSFIRGAGMEYTHDDQIGSVGGGNHFCEFQVVEEVFDRRLAYAWELKPGNIAIMAHSGSLGIGHIVGNHFTDLARDLYPEGLRHTHDFYVLPIDKASAYLSAMYNAANFAFANRLFLGLMMVRALSECLNRKVAHRVVYDAPHNLVWPDQETFLHRKGACPADRDEPVIIPGSMGSSSYVLVGNGFQDSYCSACHGAGRSKPRQQGRSEPIEKNGLRIVSKIDMTLARHDVRVEHMKALQEEAPDKYKEITPIIETVESAGIARRVARTFPLLTVKGL